RGSGKAHPWAARPISTRCQPATAAARSVAAARRAWLSRGCFPQQPAPAQAFSAPAWQYAGAAPRLVLRALQQELRPVQVWQPRPPPSLGETVPARFQAAAAPAAKAPQKATRYAAAS